MLFNWAALYVLLHVGVTLCFPDNSCYEEGGYLANVSACPPAEQSLELAPPNTHSVRVELNSTSYSSCCVRRVAPFFTGFLYWLFFRCISRSMLFKLQTIDHYWSHMANRKTRETNSFRRPNNARIGTILVLYSVSRRKLLQSRVNGAERKIKMQPQRRLKTTEYARRSAANSTRKNCL